MNRPQLCKCMDLLKDFNPNRDPQMCPRCELPRWQDIGGITFPGCEVCGSGNTIVHKPGCTAASG